MKRRTFLGALVGGVGAVAGLLPRTSVVAAPVASPVRELQSITRKDARRAARAARAARAQFIPDIWSHEVLAQTSLATQLLNRRYAETELPLGETLHIPRWSNLSPVVVSDVSGYGHDYAVNVSLHDKILTQQLGPSERIAYLRLGDGYDDAVLRLNHDDDSA